MGSVASVYDDLRLIRSTNGFVGSSRDNLLGTIAMLGLDPSVDEDVDRARRVLRRVTQAYLDSLDRDARDTEMLKESLYNGRAIASKSLRRLLLGSTPVGNVTDFRHSLSGNQNDLRKTENTVLMTIAQNLSDTVNSDDEAHSQTAQLAVRSHLLEIISATKAIRAYMETFEEIMRTRDAPSEFQEVCERLRINLAASTSFRQLLQRSPGISERTLLFAYLLVAVQEAAVARLLLTDDVPGMSDMSLNDRYEEIPYVPKINSQGIWHRYRQWNRGVFTYLEVELNYVEAIAEAQLDLLDHLMKVPTFYP